VCILCASIGWQTNYCVIAFLAKLKIGQQLDMVQAINTINHGFLVPNVT
jgi:hypothetical protein